jgi:2-haloacid dehalogenase
MDFTTASLLTFDCYGTIIDWESGIISALRPYLPTVESGELLATYARLEAEAEREYVKYREVLRRVTRGFAKEFSVMIPDETLGDSLPSWPPFSDSRDALRRLQSRFKLAILSNIDDELFAASTQLIGIAFDWVVTAEGVKSYKPGRGHFDRIIELSGLPVGSIIHCGQSPYHDIAPARALGIRSVWVRRRGFGATLPADAQPDLLVETLADLAVEAGV